MSITLLTPIALLVALAAALPVAGALSGARRVARVRAELGLAGPDDPRRTWIPAVVVVVLLALAASQPAVSRTTTQRVRTESAALFVLDTSRSMAASRTPASPTRLDRALALARRLRAGIPDVPAGIATMTDRVLPNLLPVADVGAFDATLAQSVNVEEPPPAQTAFRATSLDALAPVPAAGYFDPSVKHRVVVLLTDGETAPFDAGSLARAYAATTLVAVQVWRGDESVFRPSGKADRVYRADPASRAALAAIASDDRHVFAEHDSRDAAASIRAAVEAGPTRGVARTRSTHPLAPYVAALVLLPLALLLRRQSASAESTTPSVGTANVRPKLTQPTTTSLR